MTEAEWLAATDSTPMLEFLRGKVSDRKLRLFACAIARSSYVCYEIEWWTQIAERLADGLVEPDELTTARQRRALLNTPRILVSWILSSDLDAHTAEVLTMGRWGQHGTVRDIFGNPFRPGSVDPTWLTSTVLALAQGIYEDRAFDRMPILADALQDADCNNADILNHLRDPNATHVRGCWAVDLVLGKE